MRCIESYCAAPIHSPSYMTELTGFRLLDGTSVKSM